MTELVADYSTLHDPRQIRDAGFVGVMRYLSLSAWKNLTIGERNALWMAGLGIGLVYEDNRGMMDGGAQAGAEKARIANEQAATLGWSRDRPIIFANDQNVFLGVHYEFMRAAQAVCAHPIGPYGNTAFCVACHDGLGTRFNWKVSTWGASTTVATMVQEANWGVPPVPAIDVNTVHAADWGGWWGGATAPAQDKQKEFLCLT